MYQGDIKEILRKGVVEFSYIKKDGSVRDAKGTLNIDIITEEHANPRGGENYPKQAGYISYYDTEVHGWRCFDPETFERK